MCSLLSPLPAPRTVFRLSKLHSNNSKLARSELGNRFYPLSRPCSVHFACHYAPPVRLAGEAITTLSNSRHCEVIYSKGVPCRQKNPPTLWTCVILKCQVRVCNPPIQSVADMDSAGWQYTPFFFPQLKRGAFVSATADPNEHGCGPPLFPEHSPN